MTKTKWIILGILLLFFVIFSFFAMNTLRDINTPRITVEIDVFELTKENVSLNISMLINNQNPYAMTLEDLRLKIMTSEEEIIGELTFPKKTIDSNKEVTIYTEGTFGFNNQPLEKFYTQISADFGVDFFGFITISLPVNIDIITDPEPIIDTIALPTISLDAEIESVNETGVLFNGSIQVNNQNDFSISLTNTDILIKHNDTAVNANVIVQDTVIRPKSTSSINFSAFVGYDLFDSGSISVALSGDVNIAVAGISLTRPFTASAETEIPDVASFLLNNERIIIALSADIDISLRGLLMNVGFRLYNPTKIPFTALELDIIIYRVDNDSKTLIAQDTLKGCPLPGKTETCLNTTFKLPVMSFLPVIGDGIPDWFLLTIRGDFVIADSNQRIPVQLNGYLNGNFFGSESLDMNMS
ncbi:MAG: hypothetical protein KGY65_04505 [Candidatus Thermoplasmatota archaeon]|nr:hypothetical protein [Candidatus Thermoplasmatota archaeon]MBS3801991.1 hypothetical protein [Candidatus Thermoplasmatota archaeon]